MSLSTVKFHEVVKKQYFFKLKAYIDTLSALIAIQFTAILFSLIGNLTSSIISSTVSVEVKVYSADLVIVFTMIWALTTAITITTKTYRYQDFTYITNRLTSSISNILFLMTASFVGALTAILSRYLLIFIAYYFTDLELYMETISIVDFFLGVAGSFLYVLLIAALGYLIGSLVQVNKLFTGIIPVVFIGFLYLDVALIREPIMENIFTFYTFESSLLLFALKVIVTAVALFAFSISILNRMEVKK